MVGSYKQKRMFVSIISEFMIQIYVQKKTKSKAKVSGFFLRSMTQTITSILWNIWTILLKSTFNKRAFFFSSYDLRAVVTHQEWCSIENVCHMTHMLKATWTVSKDAFKTLLKSCRFVFIQNNTKRKRGKKEVNGETNVTFDLKQDKSPWALSFICQYILFNRIDTW